MSKLSKEKMQVAFFPIMVDTWELNTPKHKQQTTKPMYDPDPELNGGDDYNEEPSYHSYNYNLPSKRYDWDDIDQEEE
jgi:hypothetical protein